ncbi:Hemicentin-1 [Merluccius polli]|uniref:Hemicentin-1 n=1 Tax=Merluccius polli TaxID=89951 RepID=A0AA47MK04_MERPO|nr:Hemicentin-1 [Merluccius polli]
MKERSNEEGRTDAWLHQDLTSDQYVTVRRDGSLHIERVRLQDAGEYTCLAENVVGASNRTTLLHVYVIPTMQHGPQVFGTVEGAAIALPCRASGVPTPEITWAKVRTRNPAGQQLDLGGPVFSLDPDGSLRIASPSGRETGEFVCTATNVAGFSIRKVQLTVYVRPRPGGGPDGGPDGGLDGAAEPYRVSVSEGREVTLPCEVHSFPPPTITWAKERQLISPFSPRITLRKDSVAAAARRSWDAAETFRSGPPGGGGGGSDERIITEQLHNQLPSGSMRILETRVQDAGLYVCVASNIAGNLSQSVYLSVQGTGLASGPTCVIRPVVLNRSRLRTHMCH